MRPWLVLRQFGLPFEEVPIALDRPDTRQRILRHSAAGRVPILEADGLVVWESLAIIEFLAERHPDLPIWPATAAARAEARAISAEMHAGFPALREELPFAGAARLAMPELTAAALADIERIGDIWRAARAAHRDQGAFLYGDFSAADAMYAPVALRFLTYGVAMPVGCRDYVENLLVLPALADWLRAAETAG